MHTIIVPLQMLDLHEDGFHPLIEVDVFGNLFTLVVDTGASKTAFDHQMVIGAREEIIITVSEHLSTGLGTNSMKSSTALVNDLSIGGFLFPEFEVAVLDLSTINIAYQQLGQPEVLGVLGGDILMKYKAIINYGKQTLKLKNTKREKKTTKY